MPGYPGGEDMMAVEGEELAPADQAPEPARSAIAAEQQRPTPTANSETYDHVVENDLVAVADDPLSTFSIDVDTASYSNVRRMLREGRLPPAGAVRIEEMINYFDYSYDEPTGDRPFSVFSEVGVAPWQPDRRLVHLGLKGMSVRHDDIPARNLVFLLDVSGSMSSANKLPLLVDAFGLLVGQLGERDRVSVVVYAGASGVVLPPTRGSDKRAIRSALQRLQAGGSTNGAGGIELAYALAEEHAVPGGINRVILATDGDFNVGPSSRSELVRLIEAKRRNGVYLTVLGFGTGNYKDATMEQIADHGNGNYAYIDSLDEARKVLVRELSSTLVTIAKDVKIQVEFNPEYVAAYRLVGYENRVMAHRDFNDDTKDAGEIGAGHTVTALYEVVLAGAASSPAPTTGALRYQTRRRVDPRAQSDELMTVSVRYKDPDGHESKAFSIPVRSETAIAGSADLRFSAAVAGFGMLLRGSAHSGTLTYASVRGLASQALGEDRNGYRREFLGLIDQAAQLASREHPGAAIAQ